MREIHRHDSPERKHYAIDRKSLVDINPVMLYSGTLKNAQGWRDSVHMHDFLEIIFVLSGQGTVVINDSTFHITKENIIIYNEHCRHFEQCSTDDPMEAYFIAFDKITLKNLPPNCILPEHANCIFNAGKFSKTLRALFEIIIDEISQKNEFYVDVANSVANALLMYIFRILNETQSNVDLLIKDNILNTVIPYINKNFQFDISLADVAAECFVNKFHLSHVFTENFGMSVGQYIRGKKIEMSKTYLAQTDLAISEVAEKCGFNDINYFDRTFKKLIGVTPLKYRKSLASKESETPPSPAENEL